MQKTEDIRSYTHAELENFFSLHEEKKINATRVYKQIFGDGIESLHNLSSIKPGLVKLVQENFHYERLTVFKKQISADKTIKVVFKLHDGHLIEGVLIPGDERMTACVSSQVGCSLTCRFCATGKMERKRNLLAGEIYDQVALIRNLCHEHYQREITNVVFMGMGEPLLNYNNVVTSMHHITSHLGLNMAWRRITVSTAGIAKMIRVMADDNLICNLALSLHAANDTKRSNIMPINEQNNLEELKNALIYFYSKTKTVVMYEYLLLKDFNDSLQDAEELCAFTKHIPSKVNLIHYNPAGGSRFQNSTPESLMAFKQYLFDHGVRVTTRKSRGADIDAACGQLANKNSMIQ